MIGTRLIMKKQAVFEWPWTESRNVGLDAGDLCGGTLPVLTTTRKALDPGNALFYDWFKNNQKQDRTLVVDVEGRNTAFLADQFPTLSFQTQVDKFKPQPTRETDDVLSVYLVRNILWNCSDDDCTKILQTFIPAMEKSPDTVLLINEMMSPGTGAFERHVEKGYRRREVTVMTMHNAKQRTEADWKALFAKASPNFTVGCSSAFFTLCR